MCARDQVRRCLMHFAKLHQGNANASRLIRISNSDWRRSMDGYNLPNVFLLTRFIVLDWTFSGSVLRPRRVPPDSRVCGRTGLGGGRAPGYSSASLVIFLIRLCLLLPLRAFFFNVVVADFTLCRVLENK